MQTFFNILLLFLLLWIISFCNLPDYGATNIKMFVLTTTYSTVPINFVYCASSPVGSYFPIGLYSFFVRQLPAGLYRFIFFLSSFYLPCRSEPFFLFPAALHKGSLTQDFPLKVFFLGSVSPGPWVPVSHWAKIFYENLPN
jgi:hypothetical protein